MNPSEAIKILSSLRWSELRIGRSVGVTQAAINKIKRGTSPSYETGIALIALAKKEQRKAERKAHGTHDD